MYEISFAVKSYKIEEALERLIEIGLIYTYYESPFEVTVDSNGYGFYEKEDEVINLKVFPETEDRNECVKYISKIKEVVDIKEEPTLIEIVGNDWQQPFEPVDLKNGWVIAEPEVKFDNAKKINFQSQGSFGTGIHETTQDLLRYILQYDFTRLKVLDLGAGSGILSIAAALKNAKKVIALDIRDVTNEVMHNALLNNLTNIEVVVADVTSEDLGINDVFDVIFINIGGEETLSSMNFIDTALKDKGILFVSGLVDWSSDNILASLNSRGYSLMQTTKTNEWVTLILEKIEAVAQ
jgi:ribosomal protein L11 methyltransferase